MIVVVSGIVSSWLTWNVYVINTERFTKDIIAITKSASFANEMYSVLIDRIQNDFVTISLIESKGCSHIYRQIDGDLDLLSTMKDQSWLIPSLEGRRDSLMVRLPRLKAKLARKYCKD